MKTPTRTAIKKMKVVQVKRLLKKVYNRMGKPFMLIFFTPKKQVKATKKDYLAVLFILLDIEKIEEVGENDFKLK